MATFFSFRDSFTLVIKVECKKQVSVLGQLVWIPAALGEVRIYGVTLAYEVAGTLYLMGARGSEISINDAGIEVYDSSDKFEIFRAYTAYNNVGLVNSNDTREINSLTFVGLNGSQQGGNITNDFFEFGRMKEKSNEKKLNKALKDVEVCQTTALIPQGRIVNTSTTIYDYQTTMKYMGINGFAYNLSTNTGLTGQHLKVTTESFIGADTSYPNMIVGGRIYQWVDLVANKLYDSEDVNALVTLDVYNYNGVTHLKWSSGSDAYITARVSLSAAKVDDLSKMTNQAIYSGTSVYGVVSFDTKDWSRSTDTLLSAEIYKTNTIAVCFYGAGTSVDTFDVFSGIALLNLTAGGVIGYALSSDHVSIEVVLHDVGEAPDDAKDDDQTDEDKQKTDGSTPAGHDPTSDFEMGLNVLTTSYILSNSQLSQLGNELWSDNFMENIKLLNNSPIENILACKIFPTAFSGVTSAVKIGNVSMLSGSTAYKLSATSIKKETSAVNVAAKFGSFLDTSPFTRAKIFLPFIGFQPLNVSDFYGATIAVRYVFDVLTGSCTAFILRNGNVHSKYSGTCAVDVPITASNRAQVEVGQLQSALTGLASLSAGNAVGALSAGLSMASMPVSYNTRGNGGGTTNVYDPRQPFIVIDRPNAMPNIGAYASTMGRPCNLTKTLNTLKGFTSVHDVHLDDVPCLDSERQKLKQIMQTGFII